MEKRFIQTEFKTREKEGKKQIEGMFIVFNKRTELWPGTYEEIAPEAINNISDIRALYNHNHDLVLGSTLSGTLKLEKRDAGLFGVIDINENDQDALNAYARIQRGDIKGCSFGFVPIVEEYTEENGNQIVRVKDIDLFEVSPCVFPAYPQTEVSTRNKKEIENKFKSKRIKERREKLLETYRRSNNA